uniref:Uncharacterized protein n=1 Tax=Anopheles coluzzii TaxID=1518534 RepID=A0A8W7PLN8_ANOCL
MSLNSSAKRATSNECSFSSSTDSDTTLHSNLPDLAVRDGCTSTCGSFGIVYQRSRFCRSFSVSFTGWGSFLRGGTAAVGSGLAAAGSWSPPSIPPSPGAGFVSSGVSFSGLPSDSFLGASATSAISTSVCGLLSSAAAASAGSVFSASSVPVATAGSVSASSIFTSTCCACCASCACFSPMIASDRRASRTALMPDELTPAAAAAAAAAAAGVAAAAAAVSSPVPLEFGAASSTAGRTSCRLAPPPLASSPLELLLLRMRSN